MPRVLVSLIRNPSWSYSLTTACCVLVPFSVVGTEGRVTVTVLIWKVGTVVDPLAASWKV
jgi:hypothetical protein